MVARGLNMMLMRAAASLLAAAATEPKLAISLDDALKATALVVGAAWTYLNYVRGRTFRKRLDIEITGKILEYPDVLVFSGMCHLKNIGLAKTAFDQVGTGVSINALYQAATSGDSPFPRVEEVVVLPLFEKHDWVEPGETICDPFVAILPKQEDRLIGVRTNVMVSNGKITWQAAQITEAPLPKEKKVEEEETV